jgi:hypothetical protein
MFHPKNGSSIPKFYWLFLEMLVLFCLSSILIKSIWQVMSYFATAPHEKERLQYFASAEGRDDLYQYNQKERRTVLEVLSSEYDWCIAWLHPFLTFFCVAWWYCVAINYLLILLNAIWDANSVSKMWYFLCQNLQNFFYLPYISEGFSPLCEAYVQGFWRELLALFTAIEESHSN